MHKPDDPTPEARATFRRFGNVVLEIVLAVTLGVALGVALWVALGVSALWVLMIAAVTLLFGMVELLR